MMKISNKILVLGLCSVVAGNCIIPIQGIEPSSPKEEVIYDSTCRLCKKKRS